jgi:hypothetical protein
MARNFTKAGNYFQQEGVNCEPPEDSIPEPLSSIAKGKPAIRLPATGHYLSEFAAKLGTILADGGFYNFNGVCSTIEHNPRLNAYELTRMEPQVFRSALESHCVPFIVAKKDEKILRFNKTISVADALGTLVSPDFLKRLPPLSALNLIRLPIRREDGNIELLPPGYDPVSGIFTTSNGFQYDGYLDFESAKKFLETELLGEVCFQKDDKDRSLAVVLAEMLTLFCTHLLPAGALRPGFLFSANSEGAGKTTLAFLAIVPRLGYAAAASAARDEEEMRKEILSVALAGKPVFFLDNVKHHLSSGSLERLMTSPTVEGRILGESREVTVPHALTVIITGNGATISADLRRRVLIVELFLPEAKSEEHCFKQSLAYEEILGLAPKILAALWALVRHWRDKGRPMPSRSLNGFAAWSETVGAIVECAGFASPCLAPGGLKYSGDKDTADMEKLVEVVNPSHQYKFSELVELAQDHELFDWMIGQEGEPDIKAKSKLGKFLKKQHERIFSVSDKHGTSRLGQFSILGQTRKERRYMVQLL